MAKRSKVEPAVKTYIEGVENATRRADAEELLALFGRVTGEAAAFWPPSIIGFGRYHYRYDSGREGDSMIVGFSPRKAHQVLYVLGSVGEDHPLLIQLGKYKAGKGCLYVNKLADVDLDVLEQIIALSYKATVDKFGKLDA